MLCKLAFVTSFCEFHNLNESSSTCMNSSSLFQKWQEKETPKSLHQLSCSLSSGREACRVKVGEHLRGQYQSGRFGVFLLGSVASVTQEPVR